MESLAMFDPLYQDAALQIRGLLERVHHRTRVLEGEMAGFEQVGDEDQLIANSKTALAQARQLEDCLLQALKACGDRAPVPAEPPKVIEFQIRGPERRTTVTPGFVPERRQGQRRRSKAKKD